MCKFVVVVAMISVLLPVRLVLAGSRLNVLELLDRYAANMDRLRSWSIKSEQFSEGFRLGIKTEKNAVRELCELSFDGNRASSRCFTWENPTSAEQLISRNKARYLSLLWDGKTYTNYARRNSEDPGQAFIDEKPRDWDLHALQYRHAACFLMGIYEGTFERIDTVIREARAVSVRDQTVKINEVGCYVIDAKTKCGDFTVWLDPDHGYNIAKVQMHLSEHENHFIYDKPVESKSMSFTLENVHFAKIDGAWIAVEGDMYFLWIYATGEIFTSIIHQRLSAQT